MKLSVCREKTSPVRQAEPAASAGRKLPAPRRWLPQWAGLWPDGAMRRPRLVLRSLTPGHGYIDQSGRIATIGAVAVLAVALLLLSRSLWGQGTLIDAAISASGQSLLMAAVLGRLWATLYIGGRKNARLITAGPYSLTRNPLYFFSILGAAGAGLVFGSLAAGLLLGGAVYALLVRVARDEARLLENSFGPAYAAYAARVPLLWPRPSRYEDTPESSFRPTALGRSLRDGLLFLLLPPLAELVGYAKGAGLLPALLPLF